ncbi:MAG: Abi family protein [Negativicutes bacterium]|jgi:abortive infection bacteriophage resistance protein
MTQKCFKTLDEQIEILRARGLNIEDCAGAKAILERENYYNLINGYKYPFINKRVAPESYVAGAKFDEIFALYSFDRNIRKLFLSGLLIVENTMKSLIAYKFSEKYGHDNYLKISNFETSIPGKSQNENIARLIATAYHTIAGRLNKGQNAISHYVDNHGYVPLWVLVNAMTFGAVSVFYSLMKSQDKQEVAKHFMIADSQLKAILDALTIFRNICAHDERLYNFMLAKKSIGNSKYHAALGISMDKGGNYIVGKRDVFALMISLKKLLLKKDYDELCDNLNQEFDNLSKKLSAVSLAEIQSIMGFPSNWYDLKKM